MMNDITVETHCHTYYSKDCLMNPRRLIEVCRKRGIDRLCITDHNTCEGAFEMASLAPDLIIPGVEIMTTQGELLVLFVEHEVPHGLNPMDTIERFRAQGAVISVSHPFDYHRSGSWSESDLRLIAPYVDAIEIFNSRSINVWMNKHASLFARELGLLATVGSDAHTYSEVGKSTIYMKAYEDPDEFVTNLNSAFLNTKRSNPLVHLASRWAVLARKISNLSQEISTQ
jgi:predicted metal-dependent phosphoesterase TrpH